MKSGKESHVISLEEPMLGRKKYSYTLLDFSDLRTKIDIKQINGRK